MLSRGAAARQVRRVRQRCGRAQQAEIETEHALRGGESRKSAEFELELEVK